MMVAPDLPIIRGGLCPTCLENVRRQEQAKQDSSRPYSGLNQYTVERRKLFGIRWSELDHAILQCLQRASRDPNPVNRTMSQRMLALAVYGPTPYDARRNLRQRIYEIRKRLEQQNVPVQIKTMGQNGYTLVSRR